MIIQKYGLSFEKVKFIFSLSQKKDTKNQSTPDQVFTGSLSPGITNQHLINNSGDFFSSTDIDIQAVLAVLSRENCFRALWVVCALNVASRGEINRFLGKSASYSNRIIRLLKKHNLILGNRKFSENINLLQSLTNYQNKFNYG